MIGECVLVPEDTVVCYLHKALGRGLFLWNHGKKLIPCGRNIRIPCAAFDRWYRERYGKEIYA